MDNPIYILKTVEGVLMPIEEKSYIKEIIKKGIGIIIIILILGSFIFQDNLFSELSWNARIILIILAVVMALSDGKEEYCPSEIELQFYKDYLVLYRPKRYMDKYETRKHFTKMNYTDITKCVYKKQSQRIHIYGGGTSTWYKYNKDGTLPEKPTKIKSADKGLMFFNTSLAKDVDFVKEIETHSPLKVIVEDN